MQLTFTQLELMANFESYIPKLMKTIHKPINITSDVKKEMNNLIILFISKISNEMLRLSFSSNNKKISNSHVILGLRLFFPKEISSQLIDRFKIHIDKFNNWEEDGSKNTRREKKAGLCFPVSRVQHVVNLLGGVNMEDSNDYIGMTAVIEFLCSELLVLAARETKSQKLATVTPRHLQKSICLDENWRLLMKRLNITFYKGGVFKSLENLQMILKDRKAHEIYKLHDKVNSGTKFFDNKERRKLICKRLKSVDNLWNYLDDFIETWIVSELLLMMDLRGEDADFDQIEKRLRSKTGFIECEFPLDVEETEELLKRGAIFDKPDDDLGISGVFLWWGDRICKEVTEVCKICKEKYDPKFFSMAMKRLGYNYIIPI